MQKPARVRIKPERMSVCDHAEGVRRSGVRFSVSHLFFEISSNKFRLALRLRQLLPPQLKAAAKRRLYRRLPLPRPVEDFVTNGTIIVAEPQVTSGAIVAVRVTKDVIKSLTQ